MTTEPITIDLGHAFSGEVSLNNPMRRYAKNPILTCHEVNNVWQEPHLQVVTAHNAGIAIYKNETLMLFRSHLRCGRSVLGLARSKNGIDDWKIDRYPVLMSATAEDSFGENVDRDSVIENESGGVEDPRVMKIGDTYAITYSAYHALQKNRVRVHLATTRDFQEFLRWGPMLSRDMRNVVIFSEPVGGRYAALFRPNDTTSGDIGGIYAEIRIGYAVDWRTGPWQILDSPLMRTGFGPSAFSDKIGPGAPPLKTPHGWLNIFHGVRTTMDGNPYVLGVATHDPADPSKVKMSSMPVLFPSAADCLVAPDDYVHVPHVVFTCGAVRRDDGTILVYYGGNDTVMNLAASHEKVLIELCEEYGQNPLTGELLFDLNKAIPAHRSEPGSV